jgi:hypothetical protein
MNILKIIFLNIRILMDQNFINNFNNANNDGDGELVLLGIVILLFLAGLFLFVFFIIKKKPGDAEGEGEGDVTGEGGDTWGARSPAPAQALAIVPPDEAGGKPSFTQLMEMIADLLVGLAAGAAAEAIIRRTYNAISPSAKNLIKAELRANPRFKTQIRTKSAIRSSVKSVKNLMKAKFSNLSLLARTRLGLIWAKSLKAMGVDSARIQASIAARLGAQTAERIAARVGTAVATKATTMGPVAAAELAITGAGLYMDIENVGGFMTIDERKTSDLLRQRATTEAIQKNSYIQGPPKDDGTPDASQAIGFYPVYWGPLDEMNDDTDADGLDAVGVMIEGKMFELLFADEPDPFMLKLLENVGRRYGITTNDVQEALDASMIYDLTQEDYWGLYDRAFDMICTSQGGVLIDTGNPGVPKQCSHASESACHARSPWAEGFGPQTNDDTNYTYTEWRDREFFNKNYGPANVPQGTAGACILQDPSIHDSCNTEEMCTSGATGQLCAKNEYIRNRGICQNSSDVCRISGVSTCNRMPQQNGSGDNCETGAGGNRADLGPYANILLPDETLKSCYQDTGDYWATLLLPTGTSLYRYFKSGNAEQDIANISVAAFQALAPLMPITDPALATAAGGGAYGAYLEQNAGAGYLPSFLQGAAGGTFGGSIPVPTPVATTGQPPWNNQAPPTPPGVSSTVLPTDGGAMMHDPILNKNSCPTGSTAVTNNYCAVCPSGYILSSDGSRCYQCPANYTWVGDAYGCVTNSTLPISTNASNSPRIGESPTSYGTCPTGTTTIDMGRWNAPLCLSCPSGSTLSQTATGWTCLSCPVGLTLSSDKSVCIRDPNYTPPPPDPLAWTLVNGYTADNPADVSGYTRVDAVQAPAGASRRIITGSGINKTTDCAAACSANPACAGFNYRFDPPQNSCTLVNSVGTPYAYTSRTAALFRKNV